MKRKAIEKILGTKTMTLKSLRESEKYLHVNRSGNRKLKNTKDVMFLIWNIPAVTTCPNRTPQCECNCYACKAEKVYKAVLPRRLKNYAETLKDSFVENMIYTIETELMSKAGKTKQIVFRIHESGDFYSVQYFEKWLEIAKHFINNDRIKFIAYTKSVDFTSLYELPKNFIVRGSIWEDTKPELEKTTRENYPIYTAYDKEVIDELKKSTPIETINTINSKTGKCDFFFCHCEDCANCQACYNPNIKEIFCEKH